MSLTILKDTISERLETMFLGVPPSEPRDESLLGKARALEVRGLFNDAEWPTVLELTKFLDDPSRQSAERQSTEAWARRVAPVIIDGLDEKIARMNSGV